MTGSRERGSNSGSNRRRGTLGRQLEISMSSALLKAAVLVGGASALFSPMTAEAQATCTTDAGTQTMTCSGAATTGKSVTQSTGFYTINNGLPTAGTITNLTINNVTGGAINSTSASTPNGINFTRTNDALTDMKLTLGANVSGSGLQTGQLGAVVVSDERDSSGINAGDTVVVNNASISLESQFTAPK